METVKNKNIKVSYISSFHNNAISSNIAIKNLKNSSENYTVCFNMILPDKNIMEISNNHIINKNFNLIYFNNKLLNIINIKRTYNPLIFNNIIINPLNSMPSSSIIVNYYNYAVLNMKYNIELTNNETYTIDPEIGPMRISYNGGGFTTYGNITKNLSTGGCIFNSNGDEIGIITETLQTPAWEYQDGDHFSINVVSTFSPVNNNYNVNYIKQKIYQSTGGSNDLDVTGYKNYFQDHQKNCESNMIGAINGAFYFLNVILAVTGVSIPSPAWLFSTYQETSATSINNGYEITVNAGKSVSRAGIYWCSISYGYCTWLWGIIPEHHIKNVHEFGSCFDIYYRNNDGGTMNNPYYNDITYTSTFKIINDDKLVEFNNNNYEIQVSETFKLGQYEP